MSANAARKIENSENTININKHTNVKNIAQELSLLDTWKVFAKLEKATLIEKWKHITISFGEKAFSKTTSELCGIWAISTRDSNVLLQVGKQHTILYVDKNIQIDIAKNIINSILKRLNK